MVRAKAKGEKKAEHDGINETPVNLDKDLDALFMLPLTEFTAARNALTKRIKASGLAGEAEKISALGKPPVSAWAVNQLFWKHRDEFDRLLTAGERLAQAHASQLAGKAADVRGPMEARREAITVLLQRADLLLGNAGHNATPEIMRRITTTLESLSTRSSAFDAPIPGRLTDDVGPLGFESLAALVPGGISPPPSVVSLANAALETAEQILRETQISADQTAASLEKATALASEKERDRRQAEERFAKASADAENARRRVNDVNAEVERVGRALQDAELAVQKARADLKR